MTNWELKKIAKAIRREIWRSDLKTRKTEFLLHEINDSFPLIYIRIEKSKGLQNVGIVLEKDLALYWYEYPLFAQSRMIKVTTLYDPDCFERLFKWLKEKKMQTTKRLQTK